MSPIPQTSFLVWTFFDVSYSKPALINIKYAVSFQVKSWRFKKRWMYWCQDLGRCYQHLNFGFNWTQGVNCKGKTLLGLVKKLFVFSSIQSWYKAKHVFLSSLAGWTPKFKFLTTTGSWQDCTKVFLSPQDFKQGKNYYFEVLYDEVLCFNHSCRR